jgi:thioester reductase-like protein
MAAAQGLLLTGATGFLGRFLLRDLLAAGRRVIVLARDTPSTPARERVAELVAFARDSLGVHLPEPTVLTGDLTAPGLGLSAADRCWLGRRCHAVLHAAARVEFRRSADGEPWRTNVEGTQHLLDLCAELGLTEMHHVSTAFVCGNRAGPIGEDELERGQDFHNDYERSKHEAERRVRQAYGPRATVYRPSILVGDSRTGYTSSYHGLYRLLAAADRLAHPGPGRRSLPVRLPLTGTEPRNLVPVDWAAQAIVRLIDVPRCHGHTFHLVATEPVLARDIRASAEEALGIDGAQWAGSDRTSLTALERLLNEQWRDYWPYLAGDPVFDCRHTRAALPDWPAPRVDRKLLVRLIRFAKAAGWGRSDQAASGRPAVDCADFIERFFPAAARQSALARIPLDVTVALDVGGPDGGCWTCRWENGDLVEVRRGRAADAHVAFRLDVPTFATIALGRQSPQDAFFNRQIEIEGDVERGLKLAVLFEQFLRECPYRPEQRMETTDAVASLV